MIMGIEKSGQEITVDFAKNIILQDILIDDDAIEKESGLKVVAKSRTQKKKIKCYSCKGPHFRKHCPNIKDGKSMNEKDKVLYCSAFVAQENRTIGI